MVFRRGFRGFSFELLIEGVFFALAKLFFLIILLIYCCFWGSRRFEQLQVYGVCLV